MRNIIIDITISAVPSLAPLAINSLSKEEYPTTASFLAAIIICLILFLIIQKYKIEQKKKAIPEILAIGYFMNFVRPLTRRLTKDTEIIKEKIVEKEIIDCSNIETFIIKAELDNLPEIKEKINQLDKFSIRDKQGRDKSFAVRGEVKKNKAIIKDFPNTLFSLENYFQKEFGNKIKLKNKYVQRFYHKLEQLINDEKKQGNSLEISIINK
ncbi:MAG: hypothetical protein KAX05_06040 [Bacteroidales bacterium]|nr:hypothetical protein [Bacteroidales bacterium]